MAPASLGPGTRRRRRVLLAVGALVVAILCTPASLAGLLSADGNVAAAWFWPTATALRVFVVGLGLVFALRPWGSARAELGGWGALGLCLALGLTGQVVRLQDAPWEAAQLTFEERLRRVNAAHPRRAPLAPEALTSTLAERAQRLGLNAALGEQRRLAEHLIERGDGAGLGLLEELLGQLDELGLEPPESLRRELLHTRIAGLVAGPRPTRREDLGRARDLLIEHLAADPMDAAARWQLNLVCMERGEYPDGVPARWVLDAQRFASDEAFSTFHDEAPVLGLDREGLGGGALFEDFDGDGDLDLLRSSMEVEDPLALSLRQSDGTFLDATEPAGLAGEWGGASLLQGDFDNDGDVDVFVARGAWLGAGGGYPNSMLASDGAARFENVTEAAGLLTFRPTASAAWADIDNDGDLDLYVGNEELVGQDFPNELYRNRGDGTFEDVIRGSGLARRGFVKGATFGDVDLDGQPDLFVSCRRLGGRLYRNASKQRGRLAFRDVTKSAGLADDHPGFACGFVDLDNDGWQDLFVGGFQGREEGDPNDPLADALRAFDGERLPARLYPRLYRNQGDGTFLDLTRELGLERVVSVAGVNFADLDGDGWEDLYLGTGAPALLARQPNRLLRNDRGRGFLDVTTSAGFGHLPKGQGSAAGDFDGDGDLDLYAVHGGWFPVDRARDALLSNPGTGHGTVTLRLEGVESNRSALGARVTVRVRTPEGVRDLPRVVGTGSSLGSTSLQLEIGLGDALVIEDVRITWPSGLLQILRGVPLGGVIEIREGVPEWRLVPGSTATGG